MFVYVCLGIFLLPYKHMHYKNYKRSKGSTAIFWSKMITFILRYSTACSLEFHQFLFKWPLLGDDYKVLTVKKKKKKRHIVSLLWGGYPVATCILQSTVQKRKLTETISKSDWQALIARNPVNLSFFFYSAVLIIPFVSAGAHVKKENRRVKEMKTEIKG